MSFWTPAILEFVLTFMSQQFHRLNFDFFFPFEVYVKNHQLCIDYSLDKLIPIKYKMHVKHKFLNFYKFRVLAGFYDSTISPP